MSLQTHQARYRLGFIGGGKLAGSVMRGLVRAKFCPSGEIIVSEPNEGARESLGEELGISITADNAEVAEHADVILIGVKPGVVLEVVAGIAADKLVISLAAGVGVLTVRTRRARHGGRPSRLGMGGADAGTMAARE